MTTPIDGTYHHITRRFGLAGIRRRFPFLSDPWFVSLLIVIVFFFIFIVALRPGYETDDDISIISLASGYLGGTPVPFLIFSNVLWGLLLNLLYALHTRINWEILLFIAINFLSLWGLTYIILSRPLKASQKLFGVMTVLICDGYFLVNINFTTIAAFACISGFCLLLMAVPSHSSLKIGLFILGSALTLIGSLIRVESMLLALGMILPVLVLCFRSFHLRNLISVLVVTGVLVSACYAFDQISIRSSPNWSTFVTYNQTRSLLQDTPRLANMGGMIQKVGWSENDLVMFSHWFFPDQKTYSLEKLQYLVDHVPDKRPSLPRAVRSVFGRLLSPGGIPYLLILLAIGLSALFYAPLKKALLPFSILSTVTFVLGVYLEWTMKLPNRVMLPLLAACAIDGLCIFNWIGFREGNASSAPPRNGRFSWFNGIVLLLCLVATGWVLGQSISTSGRNIRKQAAYQQITSDLMTLQQQGKIQQNALIVSPAYGIPLEWADPMVLELPKIQYLGLGWYTFSPAYDAVLHQFGIASLPGGLYLKSNVYLMERPNIMYGIRQFIREHERVEVTTQTIYVAPNNIYDPSYKNVTLYKVVINK